MPLPSLPLRPLGQINDVPPGTWDTMPSSGISHFFRYRDSRQPHAFFSCRDSYFVGLHQQKDHIPIYQPQAFVEKTTHTQGHVKIVVPFGSRLTSTHWTLVHVVWIPFEFRETGEDNSALHVLSLPLAQYLRSLHDTEERREANTVALDEEGNYTDDDWRFRDGIVNIPIFKGYQLISEKFVFQSTTSGGDNNFRLFSPELTVRASSTVVNRWSKVIQTLPATPIPRIYGSLVAQQEKLDQAGIPRLTYRTSVKVQLPGESPDQFGALLETEFENVWPAQAVLHGHQLDPAYERSFNQSTASFSNRDLGFLVGITVDQGESTPGG